MKTKRIPALRKKLTRIFNKYIRLRDEGKGCISCTTGRVENAGHFRSTGRAPQPSMRFDEHNVNGQCVHCNFTLGGNYEDYRKGLIKRYGAKIIYLLDVKRSIKQNPWGWWQYEAMITYYTDKVKELTTTLERYEKS